MRSLSLSTLSLSAAKVGCLMYNAGYEFVTEFSEFGENLGVWLVVDILW